MAASSSLSRRKLESLCQEKLYCARARHGTWKWRENSATIRKRIGPSSGRPRGKVWGEQRRRCPEKGRENSKRAVSGRPARREERPSTSSQEKPHTKAQGGTFQSPQNQSRPKKCGMGTPPQRFLRSLQGEHRTRISYT